MEKDFLRKIKKTAENLSNEISLKSKLNKIDEVVQIPLTLINRCVEPFVSLNPVDQAQRERLKESFKAKGFDKANPVTIWRKKEGKKYTFILTEGFSRCAICEELGISSVWAILKDYKSQEEAEQAARYCEYSRRHDDAKALYRHFLALDLLALKKEPGRTNELVAKKLGISPKNAQKLIQIKASASEDIQEKLKNGEISTDAAFQTIKPEKNNKSKISTSTQKFIDGVIFALDGIKNGKSEELILQEAESHIH